MNRGLCWIVFCWKTSTRLLLLPKMSTAGWVCYQQKCKFGNASSSGEIAGTGCDLSRLFFESIQKNGRNESQILKPMKQAHSYPGRWYVAHTDNYHKRHRVIRASSRYRLRLRACL